MRINFILILMMAILIFSSFCCYAGQYYKFTDENGVVSFTDDISKIPKEQRAKLEVNQAIKSVRLNPQDAAKASEKQLAEEALKKSQGLDQEAEKLKRIKEELDKEAETINNDGINLIEEGKDIKGNKNIEAYNAKINELNERTKVYQSKQVEYIKRANAYNTKVTAQKPAK